MRVLMTCVAALMIGSAVTPSVVAAARAPLIITAFRTSGPGLTAGTSATDEFIELYNDSEMAHTVAPADGSAGYAVAASDGVVRFVIPRGMVIQPRQHFLAVNSLGYSLAANGMASADVTYTADIAPTSGIAIFSTSDQSHFSLATRLDAVGPVNEGNALFHENTGYQPVADPSSNHAVVRKADGLVIDTDNNGSDFLIVCPNGTCDRLGSPEPQNLAAPVAPSFSTIRHRLVDPVATDGYGGNIEWDNTPNIGSLVNRFGTVTINRFFTNESTVPVTLLQFRVQAITSQVGESDLRVMSSTDHVVMTATGPVAVKGLRLHEPPAQPLGGGINSALQADSITPASPLMPGEAIALSFRFGIMARGLSLGYSFRLMAEAIPPASGAITVGSRSSDGPMRDVTFCNSISWTARDDTYYTGTQRALVIGASGVLENEIGTRALLTSNPGHGTLSWGGDGSFTYTPEASFEGVDFFRYRAYTPCSSSDNEATVTIHIGGNTPPAGRWERYSVVSGHSLVAPVPGVLANDDDAESTDLQTVIVSSPQHGAFSFNGDGSFSYAPAPGFVGTDSFAYRVSDGDLQSAIVFDVIDVFEEGAPSIGGPFVFATSTTLSVAAPGLLLGARAGTGQTLSVSAREPGPVHGTVVINGDGSFSYVPRVGFVGNDSFAFGILSTSGEWAWGMASIRVVEPSQRLAIVKTHAEYFNQGRVGATYNVVVTNVGTSPITGDVTVVDRMPPDLVASAIGGAGWTCEVSTLTCTTRSQLLPGNSYPPIVVVTAVSNAAPPVVANFAAVYSGTPPIRNDESRDTTAINQIATNLKITQSSAVPIPFGGRDLTYTLVVENRGSAVATAVTVVDVLPPGTALVSAVPDGVCVGVTTITCAIGTLGTGGTYTLKLVVSTPPAGGTITNTATVASAEPETLPADNASTLTLVLAPAAQIPALSLWTLALLALLIGGLLVGRLT